MQVEIAGRLFCSRRELQRLGLTTKQIQFIGLPDTDLPNPKRYANKMNLWLIDRALPYINHDIIMCGFCRRAHRHDAPHFGNVQ